MSYPRSGFAARVAAAPALRLPDSVAAYGWTESNDYSRVYAVDLQRGNLVARVTLTTDGSGPTETEFRVLAEEYAVLLAGLEPQN